jgi:predicted Zn-dependent protease with MMP-like domain
MNDHLRNYFDQQLEEVMAELPAEAKKLFDDVPMVVDDYPSREVLQRTGVRHRAALCGLYTGVPLIHRSVMQSGIPSDVIHIYREGILRQATSRSGEINAEKLRGQIRITILHELGHHHGMTEKELRGLGYG